MLVTASTELTTATAAKPASGSVKDVLQDARNAMVTAHASPTGITVQANLRGPRSMTQNIARPTETPLQAPLKTFGSISRGGTQGPRRLKIHVVWQVAGRTRFPMEETTGATGERIIPQNLQNKEIWAHKC